MPSTIWFAPWKPGLADRSRAADGPVLVSVTEFTAHRPWTAPGVTLAGLALRRSWDGLEGAVGLWLWAASDVTRPRSGSVSVWRDARALAGFVTRHDHVRIMRAYRKRGTLRSTSWQAAPFEHGATLRAARSLLTGEAPWPEAEAAAGPGHARSALPGRRPGRSDT
ncbi:hypothetical protein OYE22_03440 [Streptomyces sp. 71268]|uniref:hypothetical protein n=1 Tax=Streptomyces sp. 71268 TaxID=3002640 RepID=UPI0023F93E6D|nr:hypothetical protein [Streptomyces sp. 71268]WEV24360.1 hypothetical protein OYE22_03440 [Streptomyces sp. 71268]